MRNQQQREHCRLRHNCVERLEDRRLLSAVAIPRGGMIATSFTIGPAAAHAVAVQQDGKVVVAGSAAPKGFNVEAYAALARYNPDGSLDPSFGIGGKTLLSQTAGIDDTIYALAIQGDEKIVATGDHYIRNGAGETQHPLLVRLNPDGSEDQAFDSNASASLEGKVGDPRTLLVQPDGKIVIAGYRLKIPPDLAVVRLNADGTLDQQFGSGGISDVTYIPGSPVAPSATAMVRQADGKLVIGGQAVPSPNGPDKFGLLRLNPDGSVDQSFGSRGVAVTSFSSGNDWLNALSVGSDGKIVAAGFVWNGTGGYSDDAVARYNPDGSLDPTFGQGGKEALDIQVDDQLQAVAAEADGSIVAAGGSGSPGHPAMTLLRLRPDGSLDPSFGTDGKVVMQNGASFSEADAMALLGDGRVVAAGVLSATSAGPEQFAVGLFTSDGKPDPTFGVPYDINHDASVDFADLLILAQNYGKPAAFANGDLNGDGTVGFDDLLLMAQNYGNTSAVPAGEMSAINRVTRRL